LGRRAAKGNLLIDGMNVEFLPFSSISPAIWLTLLNNRDIHRHMPLAGDRWTAEAAAAWATAKDRQRQDNGYGPWALMIDGTFAGWGGFQREGGDADLALVLLPAFWGHGRAVHDLLLARGFADLHFDSITILLPPSRTRLRALARLGYRPDGEIAYDGHRFLRFRMQRPVAGDAAST
jgi:RimJ/RimL family protein N-acetyltransferase